MKQPWQNLGYLFSDVEDKLKQDNKSSQAIIFRELATLVDVENSHMCETIIDLLW